MAFKRKVGGKNDKAATLALQRKKPTVGSFDPLQPSFPPSLSSINQFLKEEMPVLMMKIGVE